MLVLEGFGVNMYLASLMRAIARMLCAVMDLLWSPKSDDWGMIGSSSAWVITEVVHASSCCMRSNI